MGESITIAATGDSFITRRYPDQNSVAFSEIASLIQSAQVRFTNLEVTTHHYEGYPSAFSGGTWAIAPPNVLKDLKDYGFNLLAWANNHTMDYSYGGLEATKRYLDKYEFVHAGVGMNLAEASSPKYLETPGGRVALISVTSTFHESWVAGDQRPDIIGRPGINPLRFETVYQLPKDKIKALQEIAGKTSINASRNLNIKEGFEVNKDDGTFIFGKHKFKEGDTEADLTIIDKRDKERVIKSIEEAKRQADYIIVSIHSHEMEGEDKSKPAEFIKEFSRICVDAGAHSIIGHGPHILRGIEIYKNVPIFYSIGNFIFQNETVNRLPSDFYEKYRLQHEHNVADALDERTDNNRKGLGVNPFVWESVIPYWKMEDGKLKELLLYPIELGFNEERYKRGWPVLSSNQSILNHLQQLSEPFNTKIEIKNNIGKVII